MIYSAIVFIILTFIFYIFAKRSSDRRLAHLALCGFAPENNCSIKTIKIPEITTEISNNQTVSSHDKNILVMVAGGKSMHPFGIDTGDIMFVDTNVDCSNCVESNIVAIQKSFSFLKKCLKVRHVIDKGYDSKTKTLYTETHDGEKIRNSSHCFKGVDEHGVKSRFIGKIVAVIKKVDFDIAMSENQSIAA